MFIRFVVEEIGCDSGRRQGLFKAAMVLQESGALSGTDHDHLERIREWFNKHLEKPARLAVSPRPHRKAHALSWFRDSATERIAKMREFQQVLERYGVAVQMVKARRLGYILYEDTFQIAAYPFSDTPT